MHKQFACPRGHHWQVAVEGNLALAVQAISCPECGAAAETLSPDSSVVSATIAVACPGCGKKLKAKAAAAGKKVKCPQCQQPVPIPAAPGGAVANLSDEKTLLPAEPASQSGVKTVSGTVGRGPPGDTMPAESHKEDNPELYDFLAPAEQDDELGRLGPYRVLKVLGAGGMGVVFRAEDPQLQRPVALKAMLPSLAASKSSKERFLREARAAAAIKHDHIVAIYQVGEDRGSPFLAMEFLEGEPLDVRLGRENVLPMPEVLRIGRETAQGLAAAHERGLIHRDIKPANIWLEGKRSRAKILDFGLARAMQGEVQLTQTGAIVGTPAYMAPEQAQSRSTDHRADLFSLGCVLYVMCTGDRPFKGQDTLSILMSLATHEPPPPKQLNPKVTQELSDLIVRLLAKKPEGRPDSAQEVVEVLRSIEQDLSLSSPASKSAVRNRKQAANVDKPAAMAPRSRSRVMVLAGLALAVVAICGATAVVLMRVSTPEGEFHLEITDDAVAVAVDKQGGIKLIDRNRKEKVYFIKARQSQQLPGGEYELVVTDPDAGLEFSTRTFMIKGKDTPASVRVSFKKTIAKTVEAPPNQGEAQWVRLFNGKDLTGWYGGQDCFRVEGEELVANAEKGGGLLTLQDYADFTLRLEFKLSPKANSGVFLRARPDKYVNPSLEVQLHDDRGAPGSTRAGMKTGALYGLQDPSPLADLKPTGEWNSMEIELRGKSLQVSVNGTSVLDANLDKIKYPPESREAKAAARGLNETTGRIGLQAHSAKVHFRNIEIKELKAGSAKVKDPAAEPAPAAEPVGEVRRFEHSDYVKCAAFSPDGSYVLAGDVKGMLRLWNVKTGKEQANWQAHEAKMADTSRVGVNSICFSPTAQNLALSAGYDGQIRLWDINTGQEIRALAKKSDADNYHLRAEFSRDGNLVVCSGPQLRVIDVHTAEQLYRLEAPKGHFFEAKFIDERLIVCTPVGPLTLHNWKEEKTVFTFYREEQAAALALSPNGRYLLSGQIKGKVRLWDLEDRATPPKLFEGHTKTVWSVAISPDGSRGLSGSWDGTMRLWDVKSGKELHCFEITTSAKGQEWEKWVNCVAFSPDGRYAVSATSQKLVQIWRLPDQETK